MRGGDPFLVDMLLAAGAVAHSGHLLLLATNPPRERGDQTVPQPQKPRCDKAGCELLATLLMKAGAYDSSVAEGASPSFSEVLDAAKRQEEEGVTLSNLSTLI